VTVTGHRHPPLRCPQCGATTHTAALLPSSGHTGPPRDGDISICALCAAANLYTVSPGHLGLRAPTPDEGRELALDMAAARAAMAACLGAATDRRAS
jgi:hypothetical protein